MAGRKAKKESVAKKLAETIKTAEPVTVMCGDIEVHVQRHIPLRDYAEIIEGVCASCFDEDGNYLPYVRDYMIDIYILRKYTDIDMPDDIDMCLSVLDAMSKHGMADEPEETWMDAIAWVVGGRRAITDDVQRRIDFELGKYERETHDMLRQIYTTVRSFGILLGDTLEDAAKENPEPVSSDGPGSIVTDEEEKVIQMPVMDNGD